MFITGLGTALPPTRFTQAESWAGLESWEPAQSLVPRSRALLRKVLLGNNGINTRHSVVKSISEAFALTPDALHSRFTEHAPALASQAAEKALHSAGLQAADIDAVIVSTCTGCLCPA